MKSIVQVVENLLKPYIDSNIQTLTNQDNAMLNVLGAKNLLQNNGVTQTKNGITFTVNSDGSVTANGTASAQAAFWLMPTTAAFAVDTLLSGLPSGASANTFFFGGVNIGTAIDEILIPANTAIQIAIVIESGYTANNLTFKPMLRPASVSDDTYAPYAMTNNELTQAITEITYLGGISALPSITKNSFFGFSLTQDVTVSGTTLPAGTRVFGLCYTSIAHGIGIANGSYLYMLRYAGGTWSLLSTK